MFIDTTAETRDPITDQTMELVCSIKGTAMNKNRARVWIERDLSAYGFTRHDPITVSFDQDTITVIADLNGDRKVAGRIRNGKAISILDICFDASERDAMFNGAAKLNVHGSHGLLVISAKEA